MSSHDEYSSDEESDLEENQVSEVYLGFVDAPISNSDEHDEDDEPTIEDTFIGGNPVWLHPNSQPEESQIKCGTCSNKMALLAQVFAPIDGKLYDRVLYIFGCRKTSSCSRKNGSVKCLRGISKDPIKMAKIKKEAEDQAKQELDERLQADNQKKMQIELTKDLFTRSDKDSDAKNDSPFGAASNPFGAASNPFEANSNPLGKETAKETAKPAGADQNSSDHKNDTFAEALSKNLPSLKPKDSIPAGDLPSYPGYFVYVEQEKFKKITLEPELEKYKHLIESEVESEAGPSSSNKKLDSSAANLNPQASQISSMLDDKYFEAFSNTVKHNGSQVLRYDLGGKPLLYSGRDSVAAKFTGREGAFSIPNPGYNPSSSRQFELQLMPKAILDLEARTTGSVSVDDILNGMSWGTIIVCTDIEDYVPAETFDENHVAYIEEWCGVQWEESV